MKHYFIGKYCPDISAWKKYLKVPIALFYNKYHMKHEKKKIVESKTWYDCKYQIQPTLYNFLKKDNYKCEI